jgi:hypothetical protein
MNEIFKDIPNYEGIYQVSNFGNVKSLERKLEFKGYLRTQKEKILKKISGDDYYRVNLSKCGKIKTIRVHQLVAITFLNHKPCRHKIVIDHIDSNKFNNRLDNLRLISHRENCSKEKTIKSGLPVGVSFCKINKKYKSEITINNKSKYLGLFNNIIDAENAYLKQLNIINNGKI